MLTSQNRITMRQIYLFIYLFIYLQKLIMIRNMRLKFSITILYSNANKNMYMLIKVDLHHKKVKGHKMKQSNYFHSKLKTKNVCA